MAVSGGGPRGGGGVSVEGGGACSCSAGDIDQFDPLMHRPTYALIASLCTHASPRTPCIPQVRKERAIKAKRQGHEAKVHAQKAARGKVVGKPGQRVKGGGLKPRGGVVKKGRGGKGGKPRVGQKGRGKK